ncbi:MAG TPA: TolC family protein [Thermoanaerobaculia bacterium]|nr:TolC family protein [Thermoanaerobaculia bacterium]
MKRPGGRAGIALALALLSLLVPAVRAQEPAAPPAPAVPPVLTLQQALRRALEANAGTATARSQIAAAQAQVRQLKTSILPHLDLESSATRNSREVAFNVNGFRATILPRDDWNARLIFSQPIYAGQRELMALRQARLAVTSNETGLRSTEDMVLLSTASNYLGIVQGQALVDVERKNLELADRRHKQAQAFYEAGEQTKVDVLRAETDRKAAERALAAALQSRDLAASRLRLNLALDQFPAAPIAVAPPDLKLPPLPAAEALVAQAQSNHPAIQQADLALQIARLETSKQRNARLPTLRAEGNAVDQRTSFPASQTASLAIKLTMPIFDSGEISAKVAVARERQTQAEIALDQAKRQVREDVLQALLELKTAETDLALAKEQLAAAEAEYGQSFELYRAQEATSLDLQTSEAALASSRRAVVNGTLNRDLAELNVWSAAGTLKNLILSEEGAK